MYFELILEPYSRFESSHAIRGRAEEVKCSSAQQVGEATQMREREQRLMLQELEAQDKLQGAQTLLAEAFTAVQATREQCEQVAAEARRQGARDVSAVVVQKVQKVRKFVEALEAAAETARVEARHIPG